MIISKHTPLFILLLFASGFVYSQQDTTTEKSPQIFKFNLSKLLINELAFSYESSIRKHLFEIELSYIFPTGDDNNVNSMTNTNHVTFPGLCYQGGSANLYVKWNTKRRSYYGFSLLYKHVFFNHEYVDLGKGDSGEKSYQYCSQSRDVFGLAFRMNFLKHTSSIIFDPYLAVGLRFINTNTKYESYEIHYAGQIFYFEGQRDGFRLLDDHGLSVRPYLNLGVKVGFALPRKSKKGKL